MTPGDRGARGATGRPGRGRPGRGLLRNREAAAWIWYDAWTSGFNSVVVTFVYSVYVTSSAFGDTDANSQALGTGGYVAAAVVALLAPVLGHRADRTRRPTLWLGINSSIVLALIVGLWFVRPDPGWLWPGIAMLVIAQIFSEFSAVNYNSLLRRISTPDTVGRISGIGWGTGYLGSIALLVLILFGFVVPGHFVPVPGDDAANIRATMLLTAAWFLVGMVPILLVVKDEARPREAAPPRESLFAAYRSLGRTIRRIAHESPNTLRFLIGSALFRDGLAGVFSYGGVLAAGTFGFSQQGVIVFAIAANLVAGVATVAVSSLDDRIGPKPIILTSLAITVVAGLGIFVLHAGGAMVFWVLGLALCVCVGPPQAAARGMLARVIPPGREGELFGLYQMTGRALSFLAPLGWTLAIGLGERVVGGHVQYWGILGIVVVLLAGLLVLLPVRAHATPQAAGFQVHEGPVDGVVEHG